MFVLHTYLQHPWHILVCHKDTTSRLLLTAALKQVALACACAGVLVRHLLQDTTIARKVVEDVFGLTRRREYYVFGALVVIVILDGYSNKHLSSHIVSIPGARFLFFKQGLVLLLVQHHYLKVVCFVAAEAQRPIRPLLLIIDHVLRVYLLLVGGDEARLE